jgi:hypothetical protein
MTVSSVVETKSTSPDREIYLDEGARKILQYLMRSPRTPLTPEIVSTDEIRYPQAEQVTQLNASENLALFNRMVAAKVLVADLTDKAPACPECGSHQLSTRYLCPKCFSYDVERSFLYEHLKCGKVASDDTFKKGEQLMCPKCQTVLHNFGVEYRAVGAWYKCKNCSESFNEPTHSHFCRPRRHQFNSDRTRLVPVYQYRINPATMSETRRQLLIYSDAVAMMESLGLTVSAPHALPGKSGPQDFDIVATHKGRWGTKTIAVDVVSSDARVLVEAVHDFAAKVKEARPSESYLVAIPGINDDARLLAKNLRLNIVEGPSVKEAMTTLLSQKTFRDISA